MLLWEFIQNFLEVIYTDTAEYNDKVSGQIISLKKRVTSIKLQTIPRLDLLSALILTRIMKSACPIFMTEL